MAAACWLPWPPASCPSRPRAVACRSPATRNGARRWWAEDLIPQGNHRNDGTGKPAGRMKGRSKMSPKTSEPEAWKADHHHCHPHVSNCRSLGLNLSKLCFCCSLLTLIKTFLDGEAFDPDILGSLAGGLSLQSVLLAWSAFQLKMSCAKQMPSDCSPA